MLELEVVHLEQYLLTLYRKAFDQQTSLYSSNKEERLTPLTTPNRMFAEVSRPDITFSSKGENSAFQPTLQSLSNGIEEKNSDSSVLRCHSSLSNRSAFSIRTSPPAEALSKTVRACHSQPLSMMEVNISLSSLFLCILFIYYIILYYYYCFNLFEFFLYLVIFIYDEKNEGYHLD